MSVVASSELPSEVPKSRNETSLSRSHTQGGLPNITWNSNPEALSNKLHQDKPTQRQLSFPVSYGNCLWTSPSRPNYKARFELQNKTPWKSVFNKQNKQTSKDKTQWDLTRDPLPAAGEMACLRPSLGCPGKLRISPARQFPEPQSPPLLGKGFL